MKQFLKILLNIVKYFFLTVFVLILCTVVYYILAVKIDIPEGNDLSLLKKERQKIGENFYVLDNNWLRKNKQGIWEMYLEGSAFERGVAHGKLAKELVIKQEDNFVAQLREMIPSDTYINFLKYLIKWFNRDIDDAIPEEYKNEIYGVSFSASDKYDFIGTNYERILNYHASHDIGHALQQSNLLPGCTAFSTWGSRSKDSSLILGRNFDFFVGEGFAEDKIICFVKPDSGFKFMYVTWGGFTGVVSGMNDQGLTVTLNAATSSMPSGAATPISILAREILQYASNIKEAYAIAEKRNTFVSEAIMIGSAKDNKTFIIEKSPSKMGLFETTENQISCSNHYQGRVFNSTDDVKERSSLYRYARLQQLLKRYGPLDEKKVALILRDQKGLDDKNIGLGNEKALNQLLAHHSIIFKPLQKKVWLSANPYQLGTYVSYDLDSVFSNFIGMKIEHKIDDAALAIPADSFLLSKEYQNFLIYKGLKKTFKENKNKLLPVFNDFYVSNFIASNPEFYYTYYILGDYFKNNRKDYSTALKYYKIALTKEIPRDNEIEHLNKSILECNKQLEKKDNH